MGAYRSVGRTITLALALIAVAGCATGGGGSGGGGGGSAPLTADDLQATSEPNLYNAVRRLRPNWLRPRGSQISSGEVALFVNGTPTGTVSQLNSIPIESVTEIRYYSPSEAGFTFGTAGGNAGVVAVSTLR
jgi:hypothetical protein